MKKLQINECDVVQQIKVIIIHGDKKMSEILEEVLELYKNGNKDN